MRLDGLDDRAHFDQLTQAPPPEFRHGEFFLEPQVDLAHLLVDRIGRLDQLAAVLRQRPDRALAEHGFGSRAPVVAVDNIIRLQFGKYIVIQHIVLHHHAIHAVKTFIQPDALLKRDGRKPHTADQCAVTQRTHDNGAVFVRLLYDMQVPLVDDIRAEAGVNGFHNLMLLVFWQSFRISAGLSRGAPRILRLWISPGT